MAGVIISALMMGTGLGPSTLYDAPRSDHDSGHAVGGWLRSAFSAIEDAGEPLHLGDDLVSQSFGNGVLWRSLSGRRFRFAHSALGALAGQLQLFMFQPPLGCQKALHEMHIA
jgi:hypothetical protein